MASQGLALLLIAGSALVACADSMTEPPPPTVTSIEVTPATATLVSLGDTAQLSATASDASGNTIAGVSFTWSSSDENCAAVSSAGLVTAAANGTATITATTAGVSGTASLTVAQVVAAVAVTPSPTTLTSIDETAQLTASALDANGHEVAGQDFTWESSGENVATVSATGLVTAVENGTATVTATTDGVIGDAQVTVAQEVAAVTVTPATARLTTLEETVQLSASAEDANGHAIDGKAFTWGSSNESIAAVSSEGLVTAAANGVATITATTDGVGGDAEVTVAQEAATVTVTPATVTFSSFGETTELEATAYDDGGHEITAASFTWESSDESIATVSASGLVTAVANGAAVITATADGVSDAADVTVAQEVAAVSVTPETTSFTALGETAQLTASALDANGHEVASQDFTWESSNGSVASVSLAGLVTAEANGTATVTATTDGVAGDAEVTVAQEAATVEVSPIGVSISGVGATHQFTVEAWDAGDSPIPDLWINAEWASLNPNVATIDPLTGEAAVVGSGQVTIQVEVDEVVAYAVLTATTPGLPRVNLWAELNSGVTHHMEALWGTSATDVFAVTEGRVLHYDGVTWRTVFWEGFNIKMDVWGSSASDVYVVGHFGNVLHYDGTFWSLMASGMSDMLSAVWGASPNDIFAVSWDGTFVHFDGQRWSSTDSPVPGLELYDVWGTSASDVYAVGGSLGSTHAFHYDGTSWSDIWTGLPYGIENVWGVSDTDIFAAYAGYVFRYDGASWTGIAFDAPIDINAIWGSSNSEVYFAGADTLGNAAVLHYDGSHGWTLTSSPLKVGLSDIWGAPTGEVFASGGEGTILRGYRGGTVAVTPASATISGNENRVQLVASAADAAGSAVAEVPFTWTSDDEAVAAVDHAGLVTGLANGTATITARAFGGAAATGTVTVALTQMPPTALIDSPEQDTTLTLGETVSFLGTASDADGTIDSHHWDFGDGNGASVEDPGEHTYADVGIYMVTYRVVDDDGASSPTASVAVTVVLNQAPTAAITDPANGATFSAEETVTFTGSGTDHEDGDLTGSALVWTSSLDGQIGTGTSFTRDDLSTGTHTIGLAATDSDGGRGMAFVTVTVYGTGPIVPGVWHSTTGSGFSFDFTVDAGADYVTQIQYFWAGLSCDGVTYVSGSTTYTPGGGRPIMDRQFTVAPPPDYPTITGTFDDNGTAASGNWQWLSCSGTWQGTPL